MRELLEESATSLAARVRAREVSPLELVELHVDRALEVNRHLNAIVNPLYEQAIDRAREATEELVRADPAELPPLFGVPCTVKEVFAVPGLPWTGGLHARRGRIPTEDEVSTVYRRMTAAGGIVLGTTNVPEGAMWYETYNTVYGRTRNPHDTRCIPGGSSGGEAAIIGAGASPFGVGSDIGGSIRMPCHFCGIPGHKPSPNLVPGSGQFPWAEGQRLQYAVAGPMARRMEDVELLLGILAGPDGRDASVTGTFTPRPLPEPSEVHVSFYEDGQFRSTPAVREAVRRAAAVLADRGMVVEPWRPPLLDRGLDIWGAAVELSGGDPFCTVLGDGEPVNPWWHMVLWALRRSPHTFPALMLGLTESFAPLVEGQLHRRAEDRLPLKRSVEERLGTRGVMLCPAFPRSAPRHDVPLLRPFEWVSTGIFNVLELPATVVPVARDERDLPIGVQVVGSQGNDALTIAVGKVLEEELGGWRRGRGLHAV